MNVRKWSPAAEVVIKNVKIYTVDISVDEIRRGRRDFTVIERGYVAAKDSKTIEVSEGSPRNELIGQDTEVIDGEGKVLIPGLFDSHMHAMFAGVELMGLSFKNSSRKEELLAAVAEKASRTPPGEWIKGSDWNELVWEIKEPPTRAELDLVAPNNPVLCCRLCHHVYAVNSMALELAGVGADTPNPDGGSFGRDSDGNPNGLIYENSAMGVIDRAVPKLTEAEHIHAIEMIGKVMNSRGLTGCIDANMDFDSMRAYLQALKQGKLTYRENMMFYLDKAWGDVPYHLRRIREMPAVTGFGNDMLKFNGIKVTLDGIPCTGTAAMRKPYYHMPETSGYTTITEDEMIEIARLSASCNWQIGIHCCGDRSADIAIKAFIEAYKVNSGDLRHYIIHHAIMQPDQLPLMREYNIPVTVQPTINSTMGEGPLLGEELSNHYQLFKAFSDAGILVGGSTDFPVVSCDPFLGMYCAVTRITADGTIHRPDQCLSAADALIMWTKASTYFSHDDDKLGSIEVGNLADYVLIDTPLLEASPEQIRDTTVYRTILGGKTVYAV